MPPDPIDYELSLDEWADAAVHASSRTPVVRRVRFVGPIMLVVAAVSFWTQPDPGLALLAFVMGIVATIVMLPPVMRYTVRRRYRAALERGQRPVPAGVIHAEATEGGLAMRTAESSSVNGWSSFDRVEDAPRFILFYPTTATVIPIPKRALASPEAARELLAFAQERHRAALQAEGRKPRGRLALPGAVISWLVLIALFFALYYLMRTGSSGR